MSIDNETDFEKLRAEKKQRIDEQTRLFKNNRSLFQELTNTLIATLKEGTLSPPNSAIIEGRVKDVASFAEKCLRKWEKYNQPAWQLTDLCGVRVIVLTQDMVAPVVRFIEEHFQVLEKEDKIDLLNQSQFGYLSSHAVVALAEEHRHSYINPKGVIPDELFETHSLASSKGENQPAKPKFKAEIQVRTLLQHAWASTAHDNLYKTELKNKPRRLERQSSLIAAQLEEVDAALVQLVEEAREYRSFYGAYLSAEEIREAIVIQEVVLKHEPANAKAALKIARLADCLDDSQLRQQVEQILLPFAGTANGHILRELGMVQWKLGKEQEGRGHLERADALMPDDADTLCELGRTYIEKRQFHDALPWYKKAFTAAPQYPRALMRYIECRILAGQDATLDFISLIRLNLEQAIEASLRRIRAGMHLPHAWYDIGFFQLLLGRNHESLQAYMKGVLFTTSPEMVRAILRSLTDMQQAMHGRNADLVEGLIWIRSFLRVMLAGLFKVEKHESLAICSPDLDGFPTLTPAHDLPSSPFTQPHGPIFLVAGSCSQASQTAVAQYEPMIRDAFKEFSGILCCGGTEDGISGIIGRLEDNGAIRKIAYQPKERPFMKDKYTGCVTTTSGTFSPLDPLMLWGDLLRHGIEPSTVNLLGVRGGEIAAFEYRLALLLGAKVGVIWESGGASRDVADDPDWRHVEAIAGSPKSGPGRLLALPADQESLTAFVQQAMPNETFAQAIRETLAEAIHEDYCKDQMKSKPHELAPWQDLAQNFRESNRGLVDHFGTKLRRINLSFQRAQGEPRPFSFTPDQLELLAEMEHGRWVVERLSDGWVYGKERDTVKKTRPQLVPWSQLPDSEKDKDRKTVAQLAELLRKEGFEIISKP